MGPTAGPLYKVKLASGRVLGPLDLERIRLLILKNHINGSEIAREHPSGEWRDINLIDPIARLLIAKAEGRLSQAQLIPEPPVSSSAATVVLPSDDELSKTVITDEDGSKTIVDPMDSEQSYATRTRVAPAESDRPTEAPLRRQESATDSRDLARQTPLTPPARDIANEKTVVFQRSKIGSSSKTGMRVRNILKTVILAVALGMAGYELLSDTSGPRRNRILPVRPRLPAYVQGKSDPKLSAKIYEQAMQYYVADTVEGYRKAAKLLLVAAGEDTSNVKALAMLASCYLNLIDSSNKDENYFSVISKLIDMSRAKDVDLPETVIADVEFYTTANRPEAAQSRIVDYTRTHQFGPEMFYYLAYAFFARGDAASAARYIAQIPDNRAFSPKVFYLKGQIAERLNDRTEALAQYRKALALNRDHAKSHLRIAAILADQGLIKDAANDLDFLLKNPRLLSPKSLAQAHYLASQFYNSQSKLPQALIEIERAVRLDHENSDYLLEYYSLKARAGDSDPHIKQEARMYYFLGEGERLIKQGKYQEALTQFQEARQSDMRSPLPLEKIGDMFMYLHDISNARETYKLAAGNAPRSIEIWSKYIDTLIQSYEWDAADKAMDRFRKLPVPQSAIDKLAGDMYAKQRRYAEAQVFYRKAMARDVIDPKVYIAYAESLAATKNYNDATFFYALALRFDPLNTEAVLGTARAVAQSESIDRAIGLLRDELSKGTHGRAELFAGIAELQIQKADWTGAQQSVSQAMAANPDYAYPWKLQAEIYMNRENVDKKALDRALDAYKSYSDRNVSDPSGYMERYKIFIKKTEYDKANEELDRVYAIYPKYPNLHFYKGALYALMQNHKVAVEEFKQELKNNPNSVTAMIALGKEYVELGAPRDALKLFNQAMGLAPKAAEPKNEAAYANYLLKNYQGAIALYNAALAYDHANPMLYKRLGMAYLAIGDRRNASSAFRKYLEMEPDAPDRAQFQRFL